MHRCVSKVDHTGRGISPAPAYHRGIRFNGRWISRSNPAPLRVRVLELGRDIEFPFAPESPPSGASTSPVSSAPAGITARRLPAARRGPLVAHLVRWTMCHGLDQRHLLGEPRGEHPFCSTVPTRVTDYRATTCSVLRTTPTTSRSLAEAGLAARAAFHLVPAPRASGRRCGWAGARRTRIGRLRSPLTLRVGKSASNRGSRAARSPRVSASESRRAARCSLPIPTIASMEVHRGSPVLSARRLAQLASLASRSANRARRAWSCGRAR